MRVLVGCEYSGTVRDAFTRLGHDAMSCDLLPTESPGPHYQGDIFDVIHDSWDLAVMHPPLHLPHERRQPLALRPAPLHAGQAVRLRALGGPNRGRRVLQAAARL